MQIYFMQARFPDKLKKQSSKTKIYKKPQKTYKAKGICQTQKYSTT